MWRYPDGTYRQSHPARVEHDGYVHTFTDLTRDQLDGIGYNEAVQLKRDPFTTYETKWNKGEDLVYREAAISSTVDENARYESSVITKQTEITTKANSYLAALGEEYGAMEMMTWDQQYSEALAYQADSAASVPLLTAIATARGEEVADLAASIIANRAEWVALSGNVVGQRLAYQDALEAATTYDEVMAIAVSYESSADAEE
ncbi:MAG: hypothetical protein AB7E51_15170 [Pseudodesulfovibrio sp.]|uniref:hypothetical protein n=1 Tax=Pseudodesulfovibrio sp. TaxID=2035812 RepID=UPI003D0C7D95